MNYVPAQLLRPAKLNDLTGPTILLPEPDREDAFLVTAGDPAHACFIGGKYAGHGFPLEQGGHWRGMAIEDVRFEVDLTSAFKPAFIEQPLGAFIRAGSEVQVLIETKDSHGFNQASRVPVLGQLPESSSDCEVGFRKWRAIVGEGVNSITVFSFEATRTANM